MKGKYLKNIRGKRHAVLRCSRNNSKRILSKSFSFVAYSRKLKVKDPVFPGSPKIKRHLDTNK